MNFIERLLASQASGIIIRVGSKLAVDSVKWFFKKYGGKIEAVEKYITSVDDGIERTLGVDIPDEYQARFDKAVHTAFDMVEATLTDGVKWRELMRAVKSGKFDEYTANKIEELKDLPYSKALMSLPSEAKEYISNLKEKLARVEFSSIWEIFVKGGQPIPHEKVKAALAIRAKTHKEEIKTVEKLIEESKARQEKLK